MIFVPGFTGVAFGTAAEGDARTNEAARAHFGAAGAPRAWAYVSQVHGAGVAWANRPGHLGDGDALVTDQPGLAITVATADCVPIAFEGPGFVAVVHAGWRGMKAGVIPAVLRAVDRRGYSPQRAAIGPAIGACCYEVGPDVLAHFPDNTGVTTWGASSVDLVGAVVAQLVGLELWVSDRCTMTDDEMYSYRRNRTKHRQVAVAWLPSS